LTEQALPEALRNWTVNQIVPAAPSVPSTDPRSAEASQRPVAGRSPDGLVVAGGVVGAVSGGGAVSGRWDTGDGPAAVEWALQPVTATTAANMTAAMILAGRMAPPPKQHDPVSA